LGGNFLGSGVDEKGHLRKDGSPEKKNLKKTDLVLKRKLPETGTKEQPPGKQVRGKRNKLTSEWSKKPNGKSHERVESDMGRLPKKS